MKHIVLVSGKNTSTIEDLFNQLDENFDFLSTTMRIDDFNNHVKYTNPEFFIYCIGTENENTFQKMYSNFETLHKHKIPMILIGSQEECDLFVKKTNEVPTLSLIKPITAQKIQESIFAYIREQEEIARQEEEARKAALAEAEANRQRHILVVDDDPMMLKLIKEYLKDEYAVATAPSGRVALKFLESKKTDMVLLDYEMPVENGPMVFEKIRSIETMKDIPIVFLTGVSDKEKIAGVLAMKPQGYVLKPIERDKLIEIIKKLVK